MTPTFEVCVVDGCTRKQRTKHDGLCSMHKSRLARNGTLHYVGHKPVSIQDSIEKRITRGDSEDECWTWSGYHNRGYAVLRRKHANIKVHRWIYEKYIGNLTPGLVVDHACGNRGCLNPAHLRQVTNRENVENFTTAVRSHNTSGHRGVSFHRASGLWTARVTVKGKTILTYHKTIEEAAKAAVELRLRHHTYNDRDRLTG